jgi:transglutaminase-like putative cysteine protease
VVSRVKVENPNEEDSYTLLVEVRKSTWDGQNGLPFPVSDEPLKRYLEKTLQIQPDHPDIRKTAEKIVGTESAAWPAAKKINRWVYENVKKEFVDSLSSVDTLQQRRGECQSHSYLFAALARSVGIPTRVSTGMVYSEKYGGFLYHAWPEVYVGNDNWVAMDPTLGQNIADATHIKLANDENGEPFNLLQFVGKVGMNVLEAQWN